VEVVTTGTDDDDLVHDSLSEAEMYSSPSHTKPAVNQNRWHDTTDLFQSFDQQNIIRGNMVSRSASRIKTPLKAIDIDLTNKNYFLQANDQTVVGTSKIFGNYENHDQDIQYRDSDFMMEMPKSSNVSLFKCYGRQQVCLLFACIVFTRHCLYLTLY